MKYLDYACYDYSLTETETENNIISAIKLGIKNISVLPYSINTMKSIPEIKNKDISLFCAADFPYGLSDAKSRNFIVSQLCKSGIDGIDLFIPTKIISNRKYEKLRDDIKNNLEVCNENNIKLRYILEYRVYSHEILAKVCQILLSLGIDTVFPSSGTMIDDINDNLIACNYLFTKSGIKTIITGNCYTNKHYKSVNSMVDAYGIRFFHLASLSAYMLNINTYK